MTTLHPWAVDHPVSSPFAFPEGILGFIAGRFMLYSYDDGEILELLALEPRHRVLEVGFGPGGLLRRIHGRGVVELVGVDPSPCMLRDAARHNARALASGQLKIVQGTAADTKQPEGSFDRVVSVHTVALWPDLEAGLDELHRVLRSRGRLVLAWHGGRTNPWSTKGLRLPEAKLARLETALRQRFSSVERIEATRDDVFIAER